MTAAESTPGRLLRRAGWVAFAVVVAVGVPVFIRLPPWIDLTLYQVAAAEVLRGGVLYRDVFDTNFPGFVGLLAVIQAACGPSTAAVRVLDLAIVAGAVAVLTKWARGCGASGAAVAWVWAGSAWFYLSVSEFIHCQRDLWMLLPAAAAAWRRVGRVAGSADNSRRAGDVSPLSLADGVAPDSGDSRPPLAGRKTAPLRALLPAFADGLLWGVAVWIKPHVVVPALAVWLASLPYAFRAWGWRGVLRDTAGLLAGGLVMGAAGVALLKLHGAWEPFLDVMTAWNPTYMQNTLNGVSDRAWRTFYYFPPWSVLHFAAIPVTLLHVAESVVPGLWLRPIRWVYASAPDRPGRAARLVLAALYFGWAGQALVIQRSFEYAHAPETLLALILLAGQGWAAAAPVVAWLAGCGVLLNVAAHDPAVAAWVRARDPHWNYCPVALTPLANPQTLALWPRCFGPTTPELWDGLARAGGAAPAPTWVDLCRVADFLRTVDPPAGDGDVLAFHNSPHPVYLELGVRPGARFMHFETAFEVDGFVGRVAREVQTRGFRYVVSDLRMMTNVPGGPTAPGRLGPHDLPAWLPVSQRGKFPWDQPVVFRAGRYCVHRVAHPVGAVEIPAHFEIDKQGPGLP